MYHIMTLSEINPSNRPSKNIVNEKIVRPLTANSKLQELAMFRYLEFSFDSAGHVWTVLKQAQMENERRRIHRRRMRLGGDEGGIRQPGQRSRRDEPTAGTARDGDQKEDDQGTEHTQSRRASRRRRQLPPAVADDGVTGERETKEEKPRERRRDRRRDRDRPTEQAPEGQEEEEEIPEEEVTEKKQEEDDGKAKGAKKKVGDDSAATAAETKLGRRTGKERRRRRSQQSGTAGEGSETPRSTRRTDTRRRRMRSRASEANSREIESGRDDEEDDMGDQEDEADEYEQTYSTAMPLPPSAYDIVFGTGYLMTEEPKVPKFHVDFDAKKKDPKEHALAKLVREHGSLTDARTMRAAKERERQGQQHSGFDRFSYRILAVFRTLLLGNGIDVYSPLPQGVIPNRIVKLLVGIMVIFILSTLEVLCLFDNFCFERSSAAVSPLASRAVFPGALVLVFIIAPLNSIASSLYRRLIIGVVLLIDIIAVVLLLVATGFALSEARSGQVRYVSSLPINQRSSFRNITCL